MLRVPSDQEKAGELTVDVVPRPSAQIRIFGGFQVNQLRGRLVNKGLGGTKQGERTVGGIDKGGKGGMRRNRIGKQSGVKAITNEGVPKLEDNIHGDEEYEVDEEKEKKLERKGRIINSARITPARNGDNRVLNKPRLIP